MRNGLNATHDFTYMPHKRVKGRGLQLPILNDKTFQLHERCFGDRLRRAVCCEGLEYEILIDEWAENVQDRCMVPYAFDD